MKEYDSCIDCPAHKIIPDPDPDDWFNRDDVAVVCGHVTRPTVNNGNLIDKQPYLPITVACRPYNTRNETSPVPKWCPLKTITKTPNN